MYDFVRSNLKTIVGRAVLGLGHFSPCAPFSIHNPNYLVEGLVSSIDKMG